METEPRLPEKRRRRATGQEAAPPPAPAPLSVRQLQLAQAAVPAAPAAATHSGIDFAVFLMYRELGEYNWMLVCSRPGPSPPGRVTNSRLAAGPQFYRGANLAVNCSCSGTFGNDYVYKMVIGTYILKDIYLK